MSRNHGPKIVLDNLLLNLDFGNVKKFYAPGVSNILQDYTYNASTWGTYYTQRTTGIDAPDGSTNAVRVQCIKRSGTYTLTSNVATITIASHGLSSGNHYFDFTSGTGVDGFYNITVTGTNTFTIPVTAANGSGNVTLYVRSGLRVTHTTVTPNGTDTYDIDFWIRYNSGSAFAGASLSSDWRDTPLSTNWTTLATSNPGKWVHVAYSGVATNAGKEFLDLMSDTFGDWNIDFWGARIANRNSNTTAIQLKDTVGRNVFDLMRTGYAVLSDSDIQFTRSSAANTTQTVTNYIGNGTTTVTCTVPSTSSLIVGQAFVISGATANTNLNGTWVISSIPNSTTFTFGVNTSVTAGTFTTGLGTNTMSSKWGGLVRSNTSLTGNLTYTNFAYNDHTWEVWFRIDDRNPSNLDSSEGASILACYPGWHSGYLYSASTMYYYQKDGASSLPSCASWTIGTSGTQIIQGQWHQIVTTRSGNVFTPYINGVPLGTGTTTATSSTNHGVSDTLSLGGSYNNLPGYGRWMYHAKNTISNMKMYNRALTAAEVLQNFNALKGRFGL